MTMMEGTHWSSGSPSENTYRKKISDGNYKWMIDEVVAIAKSTSGSRAAAAQSSSSSLPLMSLMVSKFSIVKKKGMRSTSSLT